MVHAAHTDQTRFLERMANEFTGANFDKLAVIFPTRRGCILFRELLAAKVQRAARLPLILPVSELPRQICPVPVASDETLLLELMVIVKDLLHEETTESFLAWGQQLLTDFNEIDRQLIDPMQLFKTVHDYTALSGLFALDPDDVGGLQQFWMQFSGRSLTYLQESFMHYWAVMPAIYTAFNERLLQKGITYEGAAWRMAASRTSAFFNEYDQVAFAGFYALTGAEELLCNTLEKEGKLRLYADADAWYADAPHQEAGLFFRKGFFADRAISWKTHNLTTAKKQLTVTGSGGLTATAHEIAAILKQFRDEHPELPGSESVVVVPDNQLVFPLIEACTKLGIAVNPSMGFPLTHTPLYGLLQSIRRIRFAASDHQSEWWINDQHKLLKAHHLLRNDQKSEQVEALLQRITQPVAGIANEVRLLEDLLSSLRTTGDTEQLLIGEIRHCLQQLTARLELYHDHLNERVWWKLFLEACAGLRIPFLVKDRTGVQISGFLETRLMDYTHVMIASMNEGVFPGDPPPASLIPYAVRKAFKLPCKEEQEAVTSYHFYRLLQQAPHLHFFYNSQQDSFGGGEKSRYLYQIDQELVREHNNWTCRYEQVHIMAEGTQAAPIAIEKSPAVIETLKKKFALPENGEQKGGFSASALSAYIACPMRFYLDQVADLRPIEKHDNIDAALFGTILHGVMQDLYTGKEQIETAMGKELIAAIPELLNKIIRENFNTTNLSGNDYLMREAIQLLLERLINKDLEGSDVRLIGLEEKVSALIDIHGAGTIRLKGTFDRIDERDGAIRILDYKTGGDKIKEIEDLKVLFTDPEQKAAFQLLFYLYLYRDKHADKPVKAGIFSLKKLKSGIQFVNKGEPVEAETLQQFESLLKALIEEIFTPSKPFLQTGQHENCHYCNYKNLCQRS